MSTCASPGCLKAGINRCSVCLREPYCSGECQKGDWKSHKLICKTLKKLSLHLQPHHVVSRITVEIIEMNKAKPMNTLSNVRLLEHLVSFTEHQYGNRIKGRSYREGENGERTDNWQVEIGILDTIYNNITSHYHNDDSISLIIRDDLILPYYEKRLDLLRPWSVTSSMNILDKKQIAHTLEKLSSTECRVAGIYICKNQCDHGENHCERALSCAKLYEEGEKKTELISSALRMFYELRIAQKDIELALEIAEELYNYVAVIYNPVHPEVQKAAGTLIECLIGKGEFYDGERFAQATLDSHKDPKNGLNQESEEVALAYFNLAKLIQNQFFHKQEGDLVKAEMLIRESLRIRTLLYRYDSMQLGYCVGLLASILKLQEKKGPETRDLLERSLAIETKHLGPDSTTVAGRNYVLGFFYHEKVKGLVPITAEVRKENLLLAKSKFKEALRILMKVRGPDHKETKQASYGLDFVLNDMLIAGITH